MMTLEDWLDDLCVRFIVNIPAEELVSLERICFQIEEAQWFYEDFIRPLDPSLPSLSLKPFFQRITPRCPGLQGWPQQEMATAFEKFIQYKQRVPVRGVILLNDVMDEVLLVKGWKKNGTWSFPRGKINKGEDDLDCAIREAWEETGFDLRAAGLVKDPRKVKHIEKTMRAQNMKLFVFRGVPRDASFVPQTRKEISKIEWFRLADLPTEKRKTAQEGSGQHLVLNANKFYVVAPFVNDLKKIINAERRKDHRQSSRAVASAVAAPETHISIQPMSPAIPSSLPEVAANQMSTIPAMYTQSDASAKSNALLALLRQGPAEARAEPALLQEQHIHRFPSISLQSPPPAADLHQQIHPAAPPSSALPQLSQHTRSLLDAFSLPTVQSPPSKHVPLAKQSLLAAFTSQSPGATTSPAPTAIDIDQGNNLLRLLQRTPEVTHSVPEQPGQQAAQGAAGTSVNIQPLENPLLGLLKKQQHVAPRPDLAQQEALRAEPSAETTAANRLSDNPLLGLLKNPKPAALQQQRSYSAAVRSQPVELSAAPENKPKSLSSPKPKDALLSLLGAQATAAPQKSAQSKSRSGTTSATLDQPLDQPQLDAIVRARAAQEKITRPEATDRKLFDHKTGNIKAIPPKPIAILPKFEDKPKGQKSPRTVRQKQTNSPRRPVTPKEPPKPFQPQILKRSQLAEGDDLSSILPLRQRDEDYSEEVPKTQSVRETAKSVEKLVETRVERPVEGEIAPAGPAPLLSPPVPLESIPLSPSLNAPQVISQEEQHFFTLQRTTQVASPVPDPQRDALLALLRTPVRSPSPLSALADDQATPKAQTSVMQPQVSIDSLMRTPSVSQVISPVHEPEALGTLPRSRVSSLASTTNGVINTKPAVEKRQTATTEKAFLMQYLKGLTSQETI